MGYRSWATRVVYRSSEPGGQFQRVGWGYQPPILAGIFNPRVTGLLA
ncbi:hypothetical protein ACN4EG_16080 [Alkalinema pantanalense CENA528]